MSKHFQLLDFLRRAPKDLLQTYCNRHGILKGFDWGAGKQVPAEYAVAKLRAAGPDVLKKVTLDFHAVWDLAGAGFTRGVLNEAQYRNDAAAYETMKRLKSHLAKAFWTTLERQGYVSNAKILSDVDKLSEGAWIKRSGFPLRPGLVDQAVVDALSDALVEFFSAREHRGSNCKIDCLRRGDEEIFFAYAQDHPDTDLFWHAGQLEPQELNPSFKLIFKHNDSRRTLEIHLEGDKTVVPDLQQIFARSVIGDEIPREAPRDDQIYDLKRFREPGFRFEYSTDLGIADARITKMRFRIKGEPWRRLMVEAENFKDRDALRDLVDVVTERLPQPRLVLDQVYVNVLFHKRDGDRKAPSRTFYITDPNSIRLKKDELGEKIAEMLVQSGIERRVDGEPA